MISPEQTSDYLDALAIELGANAETRRKWRERGKISATWHGRLMHAAAKKGVTVPPEMFESFAPTRRRQARQANGF